MRTHQKPDHFVVLHYPLEKIHGNTHVFVLSCQFLTSKHKNMHVSMYFLYLVLTFTPYYIIMDKGLLFITQLCPRFPIISVDHVDHVDKPLARDVCGGVLISCCGGDPLH